MVGVREHDLNVEVFKFFGLESFDGAVCTHWHEDRCFNRAVGSMDDASTRSTVLIYVLKFKFEVLMNELIGFHD